MCPLRSLTGLLGFTDEDLREQAEAIRSGARWYVLRVRVTPVTVPRSYRLTDRFRMRGAG
ncbi:hypothetical protein QF048_007677 [Streptomyces sp. W4I9-2]|nr:hypothetical protein [Streptomyces sp. W4I9-2]